MPTTVTIIDPAGLRREKLRPEDLVRDLKGLPSAPTVLPRLKRLLGDPNSGLDDITALIRIDAGIATRVLQMANSVVYNQGAPCSTVEEAVNRVGYNQVYSIVAYAVASQVLVRSLETYGLEPGELWEISLGGALAAEVLADLTEEDRCAAYTVGLLHGVGMAAIAEWSVRHDPALYLPGKGFPDEATARELMVFGFVQAEAGAALLRKWAFAENLVEAVRWQYEPGKAGPHRRMATLLYAARWLRHAVAEGPPPLPEPQLLEPIGLAPADLERQIENVANRMAAVGAGLCAAVAPEPDRQHCPDCVRR